MQVSLSGLGGSNGPCCTAAQLSNPAWGTDSTGSTWYNMADPTQFCDPNCSTAPGTVNSTSLIPGISNTILFVAAGAAALWFFMGRG
jgi:hypothetical protein